MKGEDREGRAAAAERLLVLLVEALDAFYGAELEGEAGAVDALRALRGALRWASGVALRREMAAVDAGVPASFVRTIH